MNVLTLVDQKITPLRRGHLNQMVQTRFLKLNFQGWLTGSFILISVLAVILYIGALYFSFHYGFTARETSKRLSLAQSLVLNKELALQEKEGGLAGEELVQDSMEKISAIRYLTPESVAENTFLLHP